VTDQPRFWEAHEPVSARDRPAYGSGSMIACDGLVKIYEVAANQVVALQGLDLLVDEGELVALVGASGSGKSTLMNILGGLDAPSAGSATVAGHDLMAMTDEERTEFRRRTIGFVWQQTARNLLPYLSAFENVEMPMILQGTGGRRGRALDLLDMVGLGDRMTHRPHQMAGGEQQRVAIAVALANNPSVLLADEPTGELDTRTSNEVFQFLRAVNRDLGVTIVVVTHDPLVTNQVGRTVAIRDGRTSTETFRSGQFDDAGEHKLVAEEFVILDRAGRLQLPAEYVEELQLERRVRLTLDDDHAKVFPDREAVREEPTAVAWEHGGEVAAPSVPTARRPKAGPIVQLENLTRSYETPAHVVEALRGIDLTVERGQLVAVRGRSGSGKTTLLNLIGGLDRPTSGRVLIDGRDVGNMDEADLVQLRREQIGFIFQSFGLIPILTAGENVEIPLRMRNSATELRESRVRTALDLVGLMDRIEHRPQELSGGEQQRVGIARAIANSAPLLLADEPTRPSSLLTIRRSSISPIGLSTCLTAGSSMTPPSPDR